MLMENNSAQLFECIKKILPITGVMHIGAGNGDSIARYADANIKNVRLIEADKENFEQLKKQTLPYPGWQVINTMVAPTSGFHTFYHASNSRESSFINPSQLTSIWKNLRTTNTQQIHANTLSELLNESNDINWLVIDCFPAATILQTANDLFSKLEVIYARVLLDINAIEIEGASKQELDSLLNKHGYRCIACEESLTPNIGMAIYGRDWKKCAQDTQEKASYEQQQNNHLKIQAENFSKERENQTILFQNQSQELSTLQLKMETTLKELHEKSKQLEQFEKALSDLKIENEQIKIELTDLDKKKIQIDTLSKEKENQAILLQQQSQKLDTLQSKMETMLKELHEKNKHLEQFEKVNSDLKIENQQLKIELTDLENKKIQIETLTKEKENQIILFQKQSQELSTLQSKMETTLKELHEKNKQQEQDQKNNIDLKKQNEQLKKEKNELEQKLILKQNELIDRDKKIEENKFIEQLFDKEIIKAEAQIDLIKDILIREKAF